MEFPRFSCFAGGLCRGYEINWKVRYADCMAGEGLNLIQLIVYDFDGVMTDNRVYVDQDGREMVRVNRADGLGISGIKKIGIQQIIISTEKNPVVSTRAKKLGIPCLQGIDNKKKALIDYCKKMI